MKRANYLLLLFLVSLYACHKDCENIQAVNAGFTISEECGCGNEGLLWENYVSDTNNGGDVLFNATLDNAQYEWHIGTETYTQQNFYLNFGNTANGSIIPITLIVRKTPNTKCYPGETGVDTLTENLTINRTSHLYFGNWLGSYVDSINYKPINDTEQVVTIKNIYVSALYDSVPAIYGIQPVIDTTVAYPIAGYKELLFQYFNGGPELTGRALVDSTNNNITILLESSSTIPPNYNKKIFKGSRQ